MTGNDNQVERKRLIRLTKEERKDTALILIATQVVEAGVDIDMDVGYKDSSLLDSEEQFLGRINRSYKGNGVFGEVWFFDLDSEKTVYKNDLRVPADFTIRSENMRNVLETKEFSEYYFLLLESLKEQNREINENNIVDFFENTVGKMEFAEIAKRMRLIEDNNRNVSIYFCRDVTLEDGEVLSGKKVWDEYKALLKNQSMDYAEKKVLLSQIQSKMDYFIYEVKRYKIGNSNFIWNDQIGELYCIEDSDDYFVDGKFNEDMFECNGGLII
jgi:CRISPR-associated endonuclease/helicase Cas3